MWTEPILHVDMDSFFVEVERLDDPSLREKAVAVGGSGPRGVIASASYEAREHGVRSAQPTATALRLCPDLLVVPSAHSKYSDMSARVFSIFRTVTPLVEGLSLDEAFLDVRGLRLHYDSPVEVATEIRGRLHSELGLPASVGVAAVKFVAKLASEQRNPTVFGTYPLTTRPAFSTPCRPRPCGEWGPRREPPWSASGLRPWVTSRRYPSRRSSKPWDHRPADTCTTWRTETIPAR